MIYTTNRRKLTLKRGSAEWFNEDCPDIFDEHSNRIFHTDISDTKFEEELRGHLYKFILSSHNLFCEKYHFDTKVPNWINKMK